MSGTKSYFESHSHHRPYIKDPTFYESIFDKIEKIKVKDQIKVLDLGCGDGSFIKGLIATGIKGIFVGIDVSDSMIKQAKDNLSEFQNEHLFVADGFNLPFSDNVKFDLIHLDSVLHHLIGRTRTQSVTLVKKMLNLLMELLTEDGVLIIEEMYYISYLIPHFTSCLVFYGLKLINSVHLDLSKMRDEFQPGLEVNFFSQRQLETLLEEYGNVRLIRKYPWRQIPTLYKAFLLKEGGHISYMAGVMG